MKQQPAVLSLLIAPMLTLAYSAGDDAPRNVKVNDEEYINLAKSELKRLDVPFDNRVPRVERLEDEVVVQFPPPEGARAGSFTIRFERDSKVIIDRRIER